MPEVEFRGVRYYKVSGRGWVYADQAGWIPGSRKTFIGALIFVWWMKHGRA